MEDREIVALYFARQERAIEETDRKYGGLCRQIAGGILTVPEDAEECVADSYLRAWNSMPPQRPQKLGAWLGRVVRNLSLDRWRRLHRSRRYAGMELMLEELQECIPARETVESRVETQALTRFLNGWVRRLPREESMLFVRRYWYGVPLEQLAKELGISSGALAKRMARLRGRLRTALEKEGYAL